MARPMFQKYQEVWSTHAATYGPKTALLYQVGGFFEIYDTENLITGTSRCNIRQIAELCQFSLSVHALEGGIEQSLFGGCPEAALPKYERILVQAGYTVVVVTQRKSASGSVEDRVVDHISSPGCYLEGTQERRLVGLLLETVGRDRLVWSAAAIDLATGRIWFTEGSAADRLHQFLCWHPPSETVIWTDGIPNAAVTSVMEGLKDAKIRCAAPASVAVEESILARFWTLSHLDWLPRMPVSRRLMAAVMQFTADHMPSALASLALPTAWIPADEVRLGNSALEQLGLVSLTGGPSLLSLLDGCRSVQGRRLFRALLLQPISDVAVLEKRLDRVAALQGISVDDTVTDRCLRSLYDMSRIGRRIELGVATIADVSCLLRSYEAASALFAAHPDPATPALSAFVQGALAPWNLDTLVELARQGGSTPVSLYPFKEVPPLFAEGAAIRAEAAALCDAWSVATGIKGKDLLYLEDAEGGGFRIVGTKRRVSAALTALRDGGDDSASAIVYKASMSLTNTPLDAISARGRSWWTRWSAVWPTLWSAATRPLLTSLTDVTTWTAELDVAWNLSRIATEWSWVRPQFLAGTEESSIEVEGLRHPILERLVKVPYVAHSVSLTSPSMNGMLLYGMNASGKSSLMKAIGLCCILAQTGCPVPATLCRIRPFTSIFTRILGNDNLWAGLSSFAVEMTEFREILRHADARALVLGDELCSGTESLSATALVAAGVESLAARRTKFIFATHLHELASLPDVAAIASVKPFHLRVTYDAGADTLTYDRVLTPGSGSATYGLEVCRALDLPPGYLDRAVAIRQGLAGFNAPRPSSYSAAAVVSACEVCGSGIGLEMHHIRPQASGGPAMHTPGNLVCLCATCHDRHHGGTLVIEGWVDRGAAGRELLWHPETITHVTDEEDTLTGWIRDQRRQKIRVPTIQRVAKQIFGISLSAEQIRAV